MQFIATVDAAEGVNQLCNRLQRELAAGHKVLWLVSGGSNIVSSVEITDRISEELSHQLTILPIDERYGKDGHPDSNIAQLLAGGFKPKNATLLNILEANQSFEATVAAYGSITRQSFAKADAIISQLGIGADGHIAGILPHSIATEPTSDFVIGYDSPPYMRMTVSFAALEKVHAHYIFAFGLAKKGTMHLLESADVPRTEQPAQFLKTVNEAHIYSDQIGGKI